MLTKKNDFAVPANKIVEIITTAYRARVNIIFEGPTGCGKTSIIMQSKEKLEKREKRKIDVVVLNCSQMEPQDFLGLPYHTADHATAYAKPVFLPNEGSGILFLEDIDRTQESIRGALLNFLTHRKIVENGYVLPDDYIIVCSKNPECDAFGKQYFVEALDPAFKDRFLFVCTGFPEMKAWIEWAKNNAIHDDIIELAETSQNEFFEAASPRGWELISKIYNQLDDSSKKNITELRMFFSGILNQKWITRLVKIANHAIIADINADEILASFHKNAILQKKVKMLIDFGANDHLAYIINTIKVILAGDLVKLHRNGHFNLAAFEDFIKILPGDYREALQISLAKHEDALKILPIDFDVSNMQLIHEYLKNAISEPSRLHYSMALFFFLVRNRKLFLTYNDKSFYELLDRLTIYLPDEYQEVESVI